MQKMGIFNFEDYSKKLEKILDNFEDFCETLENPIEEEADEVEETILKIKSMKITNKQNEDKEMNKQKVFLFLYKHSIHF